MILTNKIPSPTEVLALYASVGWTSYIADPAALQFALRNSSFLVCARSVPDELL